MIFVARHKGNSLKDAHKQLLATSLKVRKYVVGEEIGLWQCGVAPHQFDRGTRLFILEGLILTLDFGTSTQMGRGAGESRSFVWQLRP